VNEPHEQRLHIPAGSTTRDGYLVDLSPQVAGWSFSGLRVLQLAPGARHELATGPDEVIVLPLQGSCVVECEGERIELDGRANVFAGPSDFAYLPTGATAVLRSDVGGRFALPAARARRRLPVRHVRASEVAVELRGAGSCSRQVNNFCTPEVFEADRLIACEVLTPGGNWSSYPPHKHDESGLAESELEEVYYFEVSSPDGQGVGYQRVYGGQETGRPVDLMAEVRTGDVVLVPYGWHGPSMAAPGYDLYYLNVMAGPGAERAWLITDDPAHSWVRETWPGTPVDPRLPFGGRAAGPAEGGKA
jgi:5-deoxy-glucuronate isomerase